MSARAEAAIATYCKRASDLPKSSYKELSERFRHRCAKLGEGPQAERRGAAGTASSSNSKEPPSSLVSAGVKRALRLSFSPPKCTTKLCMAGQTAVETATHCCPHGPGDRYGKLVCSHAILRPRAADVCLLVPSKQHVKVRELVGRPADAQPVRAQRWPLRREQL